MGSILQLIRVCDPRDVGAYVSLSFHAASFLHILTLILIFLLSPISHIVRQASPRASSLKFLPTALLLSLSHYF